MPLARIDACRFSRHIAPRSAGPVVAVSLGGLLLVMAGCYNAGRHTLAQQLHTTFKETRLGEALKDERTLSQEMLKAELAATRKAVDAERDHALAVILGAGLERTSDNKMCAPAWSSGALGSLVCDIDFRLQRLVDTPEAQKCALAAQNIEDKAICEPGGNGTVCQTDLVFQSITQENERVGDVARESTDVEAIAQIIQTLQSLLKRPVWKLECSQDGISALDKTLQKESSDPDPNVQELVQQGKSYLAECKKYLASATQRPQVLGLLPDAQRELDEQLANFSQASQQAKELKQKFDMALEAYKKQQGPNEVEEALGTIKATLDKLNVALQSAKDAGVLPLAVEDAAARYDAITAAIGRILEKKPKEGSGLESTFVDLLKIGSIRDEEKLPALLLEAERLRGELASAKARLAHAQYQRELLQERIGALREELKALINARKAAVKARPCAVGKSSIYAALQDGQPLCKQALAETLLLYANSWSVGERRARAALVLLNGDLHGQAIDLSEAAVQQWDNMLAVPIDTILKRHASGVKPEELARLLVEIAGFAAVVGVVAP